MKKILVMFFASLLFFACDNGSKPTDNNNPAPTPTPINTLKEVIINDVAQLMLRPAEMQAKGPSTSTNRLMKVVDGQTEEKAVEFIGTEGKIDNVNITSLQNLENGFIGMTARDVTIQQAKGMSYGEIPIFVNQKTNEAYTIKELANGADLILRDLTAYLKGYEGDYYFNTPNELFKLQFENNIPKVVKVGLNEKITSISNLQIDPNGNLYADEFFMFRDGALKKETPEGFLIPNGLHFGKYFMGNKRLEYNLEQNTCKIVQEYPNAYFNNHLAISVINDEKFFYQNELTFNAERPSSLFIYSLTPQFEYKEYCVKTFQQTSASSYYLPLKTKNNLFLFAFYQNSLEKKFSIFDSNTKQMLDFSFICNGDFLDFSTNYVIYTRENEFATEQVKAYFDENGIEQETILESYTPPAPEDKPLTTITL